MVTQLQAAHLASSLSVAARNIIKMPANFIRYPSGSQILSVQRSGRSRLGTALTPLRANTLDVDHCFPWSAWPCDHLWNLLPAHKEVNQREKRDRLPSANHLREAEKRITSWWSRGYALERNEALTDRFFAEAGIRVCRGSRLRWPSTWRMSFQGLEVQRLRLHLELRPGPKERNATT
jgi:HNH endonuclease